MRVLRGWTRALAVAAAVAVGACSPPVGVKQVSPRTVHEELTGDVLTRVVTVAALAVAAALATILPARRAIRVDPLIALRAD